MLLVADIGATNARFQLVHDIAEPAGEMITLSTKSMSQDVGMLEAAIHELQVDVNQVTAASFAVAGPSKKDESGDVEQNNNITVTNTGLEVSAQRLSSVLECEVVLANDFFALAHGIPYFRSLAPLGEGGVAEAAAKQNKIMLGPGSGLGLANWIYQPNEAWIVVPSEAGHMDFAPGNALEVELYGILSRHHEHVSWETILSGPGLVNLYGAMCELWGSKVEPHDAAQISQLGVDMSDPVCHQTLESFCALMGHAAGNMMLASLATGGVFIGGGIAKKILPFLETSPFRRRFEERGPMTALAKNVPTYVVCDEEPGLIGATVLLKRSLYK